VAIDPIIASTAPLAHHPEPTFVRDEDPRAAATGLADHGAREQRVA